MILKQENVHSGLATDASVHNRKLDLKPAFEAGFIFSICFKSSVYSFQIKIKNPKASFGILFISGY
jgi:hypothetical protein